VKRSFAAAVLTWLAFLILNGSAFAAPETSETFRFSLAGWEPTFLTFDGSFTGTPEAGSGIIGLPDLSDFDAYLDGYDDGPFNFMKSDLLFFEYNPALGPTSLNFILPLGGPVFLCVGASAFTPRFCDPGGHTPTGATGVISLLDDSFYTSFLPRVTPSQSAAVPEIPTWMMLIAGLAMLGLVRAGDVRARRHKKVSPVA
jgi:hypothetical protein